MIVDNPAEEDRFVGHGIRDILLRESSRRQASHLPFSSVGIQSDATRGAVGVSHPSGRQRTRWTSRKAPSGITSPDVRKIRGGSSVPSRSRHHRARTGPRELHQSTSHGPLC